jgi:hypothetical protein
LEPEEGFPGVVDSCWIWVFGSQPPEPGQIFSTRG